MAHPNEDLVREAYDVFGRGDLETLGQMMAADVVHVTPGNNPTSGEHKGQDEVFGMYGQLFELSDGTLQVQLLDATAEGDDTVVARHHATATRGDKALDQEATIVFTIEDGKISHLDEKFDDEAVNDAFWS
jgi:ketosteroid isomerase-like protein